MNWKMLFVASPIAAIVWTTPSSGQLVGTYMQGEELTSNCRSLLTFRKTGITTPKQGVEAGRCYGFVVGVLDTLALEMIKTPQAKFLGSMCLPENLNAHSASEIVANYLDTKPEARTLTGYWIVRRALSAAYPCAE